MWVEQNQSFPYFISIAAWNRFSWTDCKFPDLSSGFVIFNGFYSTPPPFNIILADSQTEVIDKSPLSSFSEYHHSLHFQMHYSTGIFRCTSIFRNTSIFRCTSIYRRALLYTLNNPGCGFVVSQIASFLACQSLCLIQYNFNELVAKSTTNSSGSQVVPAIYQMPQIFIKSCL